MDIRDFIGALLARDFLRARRERQRIRDTATVKAEAAYASVEDVVIDELRVATAQVKAGLEANGRWLADTADDPLVRESEGEDRFAAVLEPHRLWAWAAKPRLERAAADLRDARDVAFELVQPAQAFAMASEVVDCVEAYIATADAYIAADFDNGFNLEKQAHIKWRSMQTHHGLARYG